MVTVLNPSNTNHITSATDSNLVPPPPPPSTTLPPFFSDASSRPEENNSIHNSKPRRPIPPPHHHQRWPLVTGGGWHRPRCVVHETAAHVPMTEAFIQREIGRKPWIYDVIEGHREADQVLYNCETFMILPDIDAQNTAGRVLNWLVVFKDRALRSIRDLRGPIGSLAAPKPNDPRDTTMHEVDAVQPAAHTRIAGRRRKTGGNGTTGTSSSSSSTANERSRGRPKKNRRALTTLEPPAPQQPSSSSNASTATLALSKTTTTALAHDPCRPALLLLHAHDDDNEDNEPIDHLPLLRRVRETVRSLLHPSQHAETMLYFHCPPSVWQLHLHVAFPCDVLRTTNDMQKVQFLDDVISNLEIDPLYYQKATLTYVLPATHELARLFTPANLRLGSHHQCDGRPTSSSSSSSGDDPHPGEREWNPYHPCLYRHPRPGGEEEEDPEPCPRASIHHYHHPSKDARTAKGSQRGYPPPTAPWAPPPHLPKPAQYHHNHHPQLHHPSRLPTPRIPRRAPNNNSTAPSFPCRAHPPCHNWSMRMLMAATVP